LGGGYSSSSSYSMQDMNVRYIDIYLHYKIDNDNYNGIFRIDIQQTKKEYN
jgi:hypothetical protein